MPKSSCLKLTYGCPGIDYRVASLFTRYLTATGIIPKIQKSIGQFEHAEINEKDLTVQDGRSDGRTDPKYRKTLFLAKTDPWIGTFNIFFLTSFLRFHWLSSLIPGNTGTLFITHVTVFNNLGGSKSLYPNYCKQTTF